VILVSPGFLGLLGANIEVGRLIEDGDSAGAERVAVPSTTLAEQIWGRIDPTGLALDLGARGPGARVVGLVREPLPESGRDAVLYLPAGQYPFTQAYLVVRSAAGPAQVAAAIDAMLDASQRSVSLGESLSFGELVTRAEEPYRRMAIAAALAGGMQLLLMAAGLFGVVMCFADARRAEIGLRRALGARDRHVFLFLLRRHAPILVAGLCSGAVATWLAGRAVAGGPGDIREVTPLITALLVLAVAVIGALARPALQAMSSTPLAAMRGGGGSSR
jgi:putative ABC transport system permease protein